MVTAKTINAVNWLALGLGLAFAVWVSADIYQRYLLSQQGVQEFSFGEAGGTGPAVEVDLMPVIDAHLFGVVPKKPKKKKEAPKVVAEAPKTKLKLKLTGVITATPVNEALAIIEIKKGETGVIRIGEQIGKSGATLQAVEHDHIIIDHRGKLEKLPIVRKTLELEQLAASNQKTIRELNIDVAQFEALAHGDEPQDAEELLKPYINETTGRQQADEPQQKADEEAAEREADSQKQADEGVVPRAVLPPAS